MEVGLHRPAMEAASFFFNYNTGLYRPAMEAVLPSSNSPPGSAWQSLLADRMGSTFGVTGKHEEKGFDGKDDEYVEKKVYEWKTALTEAANISGSMGLL
ncbi:hypothetical protein RIF29_40269 [Crotalaria pallida]|uniref:Uncharacterized protein n=1 Tax=Crotalaria pallida TaxID=3830 RepID=A0AAN9E5U9_CROPI